MYDEDINENEEWLLDEVTGQRRKPQMSILNKNKLSKYELDELFCEE